MNVLLTCSLREQSPTRAFEEQGFTLVTITRAGCLRRFWRIEVAISCKHWLIIAKYSVFIHWNKWNCLHKKKVQLQFGTPTWPLSHCFCTPIEPLWRHTSYTHDRWTQLDQWMNVKMAQVMLFIFEITSHNETPVPEGFLLHSIQIRCTHPGTQHTLPYMGWDLHVEFHMPVKEEICYHFQYLWILV